MDAMAKYPTYFIGLVMFFSGIVVSPSFALSYECLGVDWWITPSGDNNSRSTVDCFHRFTKKEITDGFDEPD